MEPDQWNATPRRASIEEPARSVVGDGYCDACERCDAIEFVWPYLDENRPGSPVLLCPECASDTYAICDECGRTALLRKMYGMTCECCVESDTGLDH